MLAGDGWGDFRTLQPFFAQQVERLASKLVRARLAAICPSAPQPGRRHEHSHISRESSQESVRITLMYTRIQLHAFPEAAAALVVRPRAFAASCRISSTRG